MRTMTLIFVADEENMKKAIFLGWQRHAHDEKDVSKEGDEVLIQESRPISKTKSWKILEVLGGKKPVKKKAEKKDKEEIKPEEQKE